MSRTTSSGLSAKEQYEVAREHVCRENDLINFRTTWFLAVQALLFAAYFQVLALGDPDKLRAFVNPSAVIRVLVVSIALAAIAAAVGWAVSVQLALKQIRAVEAWLELQALPEGAFPPLGQRNRSIVTARTAAFVVFLAWVAMLSGTLSFAR